MSNSLFTDEIFIRIRSDKFANKTFLGVFPRDLLPIVEKGAMLSCYKYRYFK
jgi:hypothetical protein